MDFSTITIEQVLYFAGVLLFILEQYLGQTKRFKQNSTFQVLVAILKKLTAKNVKPVLFLCLLLGATYCVQGCAALRPTVEPQTVEESLYVAWAEYDAVLKTATDLVNNGFIDAELKANLGKRFDEIELSLEAVEKLLKEGSTGDTARDKLNLALEALVLVQEVLPDGA